MLCGRQNCKPNRHQSCARARAGVTRGGALREGMNAIMSGRRHEATDTLMVYSRDQISIEIRPRTTIRQLPGRYQQRDRSRNYRYPRILDLNAQGPQACTPDSINHSLRPTTLTWSGHLNLRLKLTYPDLIAEGRKHQLSCPESHLVKHKIHTILGEEPRL